LRNRKSSASSETETIASGGRTAYFSRKYVVIVASYAGPLNSGRSRNSEKICTGRSGKALIVALSPRSTATLPGTNRLFE
jgi:hypothetical protein